MICKPDSILDDIWSKVKAVCIYSGRDIQPSRDDIWSKVKAVCIDYDLPDELRILKVMLRNKMSTGFCYLF